MNDHPEGWNGAPRVDEHSVVRWATGTSRRLLADGPRGKWRIADNVDKDLGDWLIARCEGRAVAPPGAEPAAEGIRCRFCGTECDPINESDMPTDRCVDCADALGALWALVHHSMGCAYCGDCDALDALENRAGEALHRLGVGVSRPGGTE